MWPAVILNMLLPILGIIIVSNIGSAFGVHVFPDMMIIAAVGASVMALPMVSSTLCFLVVLQKQVYILKKLFFSEAFGKVFYNHYVVSAFH